MKKIGICLVLASLCLSLFSCGRNEDFTYTPYTISTMEIGTNEYDIDGCKDEKNYDKMVIRLDKDVYSLSKDTVITGRMENQNPDHGFYCIPNGYIDKKVDGEWVRLAGTQEDAYESQWAYCLRKDAETGYHYAEITKKIADIEPKATPGEYRMVMITALKPVYAEFTLTE